MVRRCWDALTSWIRSVRPAARAKPVLSWERTPSGVLYAEHASCTFEVTATEAGFLLLAHGEEAGSLRVPTDTENQACEAAVHLLSCWPRWTITAAPVVDS